jgi:hypothetical protein
MDELNTGVDLGESVQDAAVQAPEENTASSGQQNLSTFLDQASEEEPSQDGAQEQKPTGGIKGRLLASEQKGYSRGKAEAEASWQQERDRYEARIAELQEYEIRDEAKKLADAEHISLAIAERLIRAEKGLPARQQTPEQQPRQDQPRDEHGRFTARDSGDSDVQAYAKQLLDQATQIKRLTGLDVMSLYNSDDTVKRRISSREINFFDLAEEMKNGSRKMPPVVRASNGTTDGKKGILGMSDAQFERMDELIDQGVRFNVRG